MMTSHFNPQPKPEPRLYAKMHREVAAVKRARSLRFAVWARAGGLCEHCGVRCVHTTALNARRGEVDHITPRSLSKAGREDPRNMRLLCLGCHLKRHREGLDIAAIKA